MTQPVTIKYYTAHRNGNLIFIKRTRCGHFYTAVMVNNTRIHAWHKETKKFILEHSEHLVEITKNHAVCNYTF